VADQRFSVRCAGSSAELGRVLAGETPRATAVADLTLGSWTTSSLATQWLGQLIGKEVSFKSAPRATQLRSLGDAMCAGIDEEGKGNRDVLTALSTARQIARVVRRFSARLVLIAPRFGFPWRTEDRLLVEYVRDVMPEIELDVVVTGPPSPWPEGWEIELLGSTEPRPEPPNTALLALLPTALPPSALDGCAPEDVPEHVALGNGWGIVAPEARRDPRACFGGHELAKMDRPGLRNHAAYAFYHSSGVAVDPWFMCLEGWKQCYSGYRDVGLSYARAAETHAKTSEEAFAFVAHGQAMRLAMARYRDAAAMPDPDRPLPVETKRILDQMKGWALVMEGRPEEALSYLHAALRGERTEPVDKAHLFLLNITALAELRCGNFETALALEKEIEASFELLDDGAAELKFVNCINLARLYRYARDYDRSESYYGLAFGTVEGARTDNDAVNANLCMARLEETRRADERALLALVRAAMHWCSSDCPEALNWRVQGLLIGNERRTSLESFGAAAALVERLAAAFREDLERLSAACGRSVRVGSPARVRPFVHSDRHAEPPTAVRYAGGAGWGVIAARGDCPVRRYGPHHEALVAWLNAWIETAAGVSDETYYVIDRRNGSEMPTTWEQLVSSAVDFGVTEMHFDGRTLVTDPAVLAQTRRAFRLRLNPSVAGLEDAGGTPVATFKRYLPPLPIAPHERAIVDLAARGVQLADVYAHLERMNVRAAEADAAIAALRKNRLVQLIASDDVVDRIGFAPAG
jgi:tetratricopeptide (TPR) repeat protein